VTSTDFYDPWQINQAIEEGTPGLEESVRGINDPLARFLSFVMAASPPPSVIGIVLSQSAAEFTDLLFDIRVGRGRPALKGTRSLFELLVTAHDVLSSEELSNRYLDHAVMSQRVNAEITIDAEELGGAAKKSALHRANKIKRATQPQYEALLRKYGRDFVTRWAGRDLRTRAEGHGLLSEYAYYSLVSAVLHGSAGGALGLVSNIDGATVRRVGPALGICPMAFLQGLRFFDAIVALVGKSVANQEAMALRGALRQLRRLWPIYRTTLLELDRSMWPATPPPAGVAILAIIPFTKKEQ
jgi:hypothetical protein